MSMGGGGEAKSKRYILRCLLKVATEVAKRTDSERLFQKEAAHELKALAPVMVLILGMDRVISLFDLSERVQCLPTHPKPIAESTQKNSVIYCIEGSRKVEQSQCCDPTVIHR